MRFFDYNATTPLLPEARDAWLEASEAYWLNPSSPYRAGAAAHARLEEARRRLADLLEVAPQRIVFNSGATEGNNAVFEHWARSLPRGATVRVGATEHPSVIEAAKRHFQGRVNWVAPDRDDVVRPEASGVDPASAVSVMAANNETGLLNPWEEWAFLCRRHSVPMHCDASQWIGKMPPGGFGICDFVTACAHKFGGPKGVGFLLVPEDFASGFAGGAQENGRRAGTENLPGILAMLAALEAVESKRTGGMARHKEAFLAALEESLPGVERVSHAEAALWNTASIIMPEFTSTRWIRALEKRGFWVSAGSACSTGKGGPSHVLAALGVERSRAERTLRISSGWETTAEDWNALLDAILSSYQAFREEADDSNSQVITI